MHTFTYDDPYTGESRAFSLLALWLRHVTYQLTQYLTLPVLNFKQSDMADRCVARERRDACEYVRANKTSLG